MFKKATNELTALAWTLGGTGLVLITLSGETARIGWFISAASLIIHMVGTLFPFKEKEEQK
jgi:hypothetical protein